MNIQSGAKTIRHLTRIMLPLVSSDSCATLYTLLKWWQSTVQEPVAGDRQSWWRGSRDNSGK